MYAVERTLPVDELPPGTYFVAGPPMTRKSRLLREMLLAGNERGENALFVSTNADAETLLRRFGWAPEDRPTNFHVIDCISRQSGAPAVEAEHTSFASSPGDLTGMGMYITAHLGRLSELGMSNRTRVALDSVSTLLMYEDFETVFRFLHVLKNRLDVGDALGLFAVNTETHDDQRVRTLLGLGDGVVEVREENGEIEVRVVLEESSSDWYPL
ncbi:recombinase RecA [Halobacteriales archaeon QS_8_69_26]|nr:MAG: recombinase RecA [Halobacteriales archaeon QS_8_69_26]